eukprot:TRINITY_DN113374_c0_g1_i1.p1 TRINITY_DN113374_c0_g1~~TRINITY_DN113374_c0_g1_i1.p1  ORF type:complete len:175 (+),score=19.01 TRINITY_DN113374_c0_g1_i1:57-527(+)
MRTTLSAKRLKAFTGTPSYSSATQSFTPSSASSLFSLPSTHAASPVDRLAKGVVQAVHKSSSFRTSWYNITASVCLRGNAHKLKLIANCAAASDRVDKVLAKEKDVQQQAMLKKFRHKKWMKRLSLFLALRKLQSHFPEKEIKQMYSSIFPDGETY